VHKKALTLLALSLAAAAAHADVPLQTWEFKYTGAYDNVWKEWDPYWTMTGTFAGRDLNNDGNIQLDELASFIVHGTDYATCQPGEYSRCGMIEFLLKPGGNLRFLARRTSSDPEGWYGSIQSYSSMGGEYIDYYTPARNDITDYRITFNTMVSVTHVSGPVMAPAVPEPAQTGMLAAGLMLLGAVSLKRKGLTSRRIERECL